MPFVRTKYDVLISVTLLTIVTLAYFLYRMGLDGPFLLDDFYTLQALSAAGGIHDMDTVLQYIFGIEQFQIFRPLSKLSFLLDDYAWPTSSFPFKHTNLLIHLLNALLVFSLLQKLLRFRVEAHQAYFVATLATAIWVLHPLLVSTVLYVVQRMTMIACLFSLVSLLCYVSFRSARQLLAGAAWLSMSGVSALLAVLSKENAAVLLLLYPLIDHFFIKDEFPPSKSQKTLLLFFLVLFCVSFLYVGYTKSSGFEHRPFDQWERLLGQGYVLSQYLWFSIFPVSPKMTLFHDGVHQTLMQMSTFLKVIFWLPHLFMVALAVLKRFQWPIVAFGILLYYATHIVESTILPLEFMFEHRNYLGLMGLALSASAALYCLYQRLTTKALSKTLMAAMVFTPVAVLAIALTHRAALWSDDRVISSKWAAEHPHSMRAQTSFITMLAGNGMEKVALDTVGTVRDRFDSLGLDLIWIQMDCAVNPDEVVAEVDVNSVPNRPFDSSVLNNLKRMLESDQADCLQSRLRNGDFVDLTKKIEQMRYLKERTRFYAQYLDVAADIYASVGDYKSTVVAREKLYSIQPSFYTALRLSGLFLSGGDSDNARRYYLEAKRLFERGWFYDPDRSKSLNAYKEAIEKMEQADG